jgi:arylsulfatase A-like enzyme
MSDRGPSLAAHRIGALAGLSMVALLAACGGGPKTPAEPPARICEQVDPCVLFDELDRFQLLGAVEHASAPPRVDGARLLAEDFEQGVERSLVGDGDGVELLTGVEGAGSRVLRLETGKGDAPARLLSAPIPVDPGLGYLVRWSEAGQGLKPPGQDPDPPAGVSVLFYEAPKRRHDDLAAWLAEEPREPMGGLPRSARWRPPDGSFPWRRATRAFRPPADASHMVVMVAGGEPPRGVRRARFWADSIEVRSAPVPAWEGWEHDVWAEPGAHPLARRIRAAHPAHRKAKEIRDVVLAPAPSTLRTRFVVPEGARLALGYGLMVGAGAGEVGFVVRLIDGAGKRHELHDGQVASGWRPAWRDAELDLAAFAGQEVTLELLTRGRAAPDAPAEQLSRLPEARAVWTKARLERPATGHKLAVLVLVDTLGARHASGWAGPRPTTPELQRIAADGALYERALAPSPWTLSSIASLLTGLAPDRHGAGEKLGRDHWNRRRLPAEVPTLATRLQAEGWSTRAWVNNPFLTARNSALDQGFDSYLDYGTRTRQHAAEPAVEGVLDELARSAGADRFVLLHLLDPHGPYKPDEEHLARFAAEGAYDGPLGQKLKRAVYDDVLKQRIDLDDADRRRLLDLHEASIAWMDGQIGRVYDAARAGGDELLFVVVSDHGEEFWEHERFEHGHSLFDELLHVPLLVVGPDVTPGDRVATAVDASGMAGTVLGFAGAGAEGVETLPTSDVAPRPIHASHVLYGLAQRAVELDGWKYTLRHREAGRAHRRVLRSAPRHQLVELAADPDEQGNVLSEQPDRAAALHDLLVARALEGLPGAWFVLADPTRTDGPPEVTWTMEGGPGWHVDVPDFPWPDAAGAPVPRASIEVDRTQGPGVARVAVRLSGGQALVVALPGGPGGAVQVEVDGRTVPAGEQPIEPAVLMALAGRMAEGEGTPLLVGRLAGTPRSALDASGGPSGEDLEALRAIGYFE